MMNRRELLKHIALLTGASVVGAEWFLTGCKNETSAASQGLFSDNDLALLDEIAETIIPRTQTPGAKDAHTGAFMAEYIRDCYTQDNQQIVVAGLKEIEQASRDRHKAAFVSLEPGQRAAILQVFSDAAQAAQSSEIPHFFTLFQQLTLLGFFTSEQGYTQVLRFELVPGKYEGCIEYTAGQGAWAN